jgi:hypothetical protein
VSHPVSSKWWVIEKIDAEKRCLFWRDSLRKFWGFVPSTTNVGLISV